MVIFIWSGAEKQIGKAQEKYTKRTFWNSDLVYVSQYLFIISLRSILKDSFFDESLPVLLDQWCRPGSSVLQPHDVLLGRH